MFERRPPGRHRENKGTDYAGMLRDAQRGREEEAAPAPNADLAYPERLGEHSMVKFRPFDDVEGFDARDPAACADRVGRSQVLYQELARDYHIPMPGVRYKLGAGPAPEAKPGYYRVSERLEGVDLAEAIVDPRSGLDIRELDAIISQLARYYTDKVRNGGDFVADIGLSQFMYAKRNGEPSPHIYLADQEPFYSNRVEPDEQGRTAMSITEEADSLVSMIMYTRQRRPRSELALATEDTQELLESLPDSARAHPMAQHALARLSQQSDYHDLAA